MEHSCAFGKKSGREENFLKKIVRITHAVSYNYTRTRVQLRKDKFNISTFARSECSKREAVLHGRTDGRHGPPKKRHTGIWTHGVIEQLFRYRPVMGKKSGHLYKLARKL